MGRGSWYTQSGPGEAVGLGLLIRIPLCILNKGKVLFGESQAVLELEKGRSGSLLCLGTLKG